jgi:hypothetical protein
MKDRVIYSETYKKGSELLNSECIERINREGTKIEILKHSELESGFNEITVKIKFKPLKK